jgi:hypothetical protein
MPLQPPVGARAAAIDLADRRLGRALPPSYRDLLAHHDGVPGLYQGASLLGARALARGTYVDLARLVLEAEAGTVVVPFGVDDQGETIFAWDTSRGRADGELEIIVWMNEIGERVPSFSDFLELVLEMLRADVAERERTAGPMSRARPLRATEPGGRAALAVA